MTDNRFPPQRRLRSREDFAIFYADHLHAADEVLVLLARRNGRDVTRLGLSVSRKVGNAVERNRWKRRLREVFRQCQADLPPGLDLVIRPRKGAACDYHAIRRSLLPLVRRAARKLQHASK
ncbi:ribonuclease P protein component [Lignipirellula cremea]|uniref:Ribonuclease P protein component n=1 Tax=Lignipirellula cremea TaxID=2528010 RepID=A0A518DSX7_9BACT|nr:ribonuclease P protein component [Lignipirellula cremea]QDU94942.1 Ribonuclease P protein component [Lignipirellula cremea]